MVLEVTLVCGEVAGLNDELGSRGIKATGTDCRMARTSWERCGDGEKGDRDLDPGLLKVKEGEPDSKRRRTSTLEQEGGPGGEKTQQTQERERRKTRPNGSNWNDLQLDGACKMSALAKEETLQERERTSSKTQSFPRETRYSSQNARLTFSEQLIRKDKI